MAVSNFEVDTGVLAGDSKSIKSELSQMETGIDEMMGSINELDAMWDGSANQAFQVQFSEDYKIAKDFCRVLHEYIDCLDYAVSEYNDCEEKVIDVVNAINI